MNFKNLIYPSRCPICDDVIQMGEGYVCQKCKYDLPYIREPSCMKCGKQIEDVELEYCEDCRRYTRNYVRGYPLFNYVEPISSSVQRFKYGGREEYAEFYGKELAKRRGLYLKENGVTALVPVPVHKKRYIHRGYNQAELVAKVISRETGISYRTDMIVRTENTRPQKDLDDLEREENLMRAFAPGKLTGDIPECVCLIDDIYTTGATVQACTQVLLSEGVNRVYFMSITIGRV